MTRLSLFLALVLPGPAAPVAVWPTFKVYDLTPSAASPTMSGLVFSPAGGDFVLTNALVVGPRIILHDHPDIGKPTLTGPLYMSFGLTSGKPEAGGVIRYTPGSPRFRFTITEAKPGTPVRVVEAGQFLDAKVTRRGGTLYEFQGALQLSNSGDPTSVTVRFDTALPRGRQVVSGRFYQHVTAR